MQGIAIVGVGAVGGVLASLLGRAAGAQPILCARQPFERLVVEGPWGVHDDAASVHVDPAAVGPARWVLLATKAHETAGAAGWLARLCSAETTVVVVQNGVEHVARVAPLAGPAAVLPAVIDCPATRHAPGRVRCYRAPRLTLPASDTGAACAALLGRAGIAVETTADFVTAAWRKLCVNTVSGTIPALCEQPRGVFRRPDVAALVRAVVGECIAVGRAEGARLEDELADRILADLCAGSPDALTSMLVDRRAGRQLEVDARNGAVVRIGKKHGIATPYNHALHALASAVNAP